MFFKKKSYQTTALLNQHTPCKEICDNESYFKTKRNRISDQCNLIYTIQPFPDKLNICC